jgi:hypothetical protein
MKKKFVPLTLHSIFRRSLATSTTVRKYSSRRSPDADSFHNTPRSRVLAQIFGKNPIFYEDSLNLKKLILEENKGKSGIYM